MVMIWGFFIIALFTTYMGILWEHKTIGKFAAFYEVLSCSDARYELLTL